MGSLTSCVKKAGAALSAEDKNAILEAARVNRKAGMSTAEAAKAAVRARLEAVQSELAAEQSQVSTVDTKDQPKTLKERAEAMAAKGQPVHQDPGQAPEVATKAVVSEAVAKAADNRDRKPSEMRAELLRMIDEAIPNAKDATDQDVQVYESTAPGTRMTDTEQAEYKRLGTGQPRDKYMQRLAKDKAALHERAAERIGFVDFAVRGDGRFKVLNTVERLKEFRAKVESSPGFKDRAGIPKPDGLVGGEKGYGGASAVAGMIDEGDPQAAVDYAAARGLDVAEVLKGDKARLGKVAGLTPTAEAVGEFEPEAAATEPAAPAQPEAPPAQQAEPSAPAPAEPRDQKADSMRRKPEGEKAATAKIGDFGEKLEGARKDYATTLKDAEAVDVAAEPLSKSWPEPDYQKLLDSGVDPYIVAVVRATRDEVPTKPQKAWKLKGWVDTVKALRETARSLLAGDVKSDAARKIVNTTTGLISVRGRAELYEELGHDRSLKGVTFGENFYSFYRGQNNVRKWVVEQKAKATAFSNWPRELAVADTREAALQAFKDKLGNLDLGGRAKGQPQFVVYRKSGEGGAFVGKKIGREYIDLHKAADVAAARAYMQSNAADLEKALEAYKATPFERKSENQPRVGDDHRNGAPVTPEVFAETFGFRGVQFGNYVEQGRRQSDLNEAFDGLMDLAAILGIPPRALSLNGQLGLAFGARGKGGTNAAAAHYEPDKVVINLTKGSGAGSLAHEWWHALDNYFAKKGESTGFVTGGANAAALREQMRAAFEVVKRGTSGMAYQQRARELDKRRSKAYWNTPEERSARAFESYVIAKLQDQGVSNDYLANVVSEQFWNASEALRAGMFSEGENKPTYPYPLPSELPAVRAGFDEFFKTVETSTDDAGNVALFSRTGNFATGFVSPPLLRKEITRITDNWDADMADVSVVNRVEDLPSAIQAAVRNVGAENQVRGLAMPDGKVYIVAENIGSVDEGRFVLFHEVYGHVGMRAFLGDNYGMHMALLRKANPALAREADAWFKLYGEDEIAARVAAGFPPLKARQMVNALAVEEALADRAGSLPELKGWQRVLAALQRGLRRMGLGSVADMLEGMTEAETLDLLVQARKTVQAGQRMRAGEMEPAMSRRTDQTQTPEFKRWFGESRVVDAEGKPLVVYHGTTADFTEFDRKKATSGLYGTGFYFTDSRAMADKYAEGGKTMDVYLSLKNPAPQRVANEVVDQIGEDDMDGIRAELERRGYDGVMMRSAGELLAVAFRPEQIKSAIGNTGAFDPTNADIRFSRRTSQDILNAGGGVQDFSRYGKTKQDRLRGILDKGREFYLGALTRDQIADVYGGDVPQVREYDKLVRSMENERSSLAQRADDLYQRWAKMDAGTNDKLGRIMLDATTEQVHPDSDKAPRGKAEVHAKLRQEFQALPAEAQAMYREVRDFHAGVLEDIKASLIGRIKRQVAAGAERAALLSKVQQQFDQYLENGPYFPLSRFGDYLVIATRPDGERVVAAYENAGEQQAAARELRKDGFTTKLKTAKDYARSQDGSAGKFIGDVIQAVEKVDMAEATINGSRSDLKNQLLDDLNQLFIRSLPDLSYRKHFAHRKNTPGFSADVMRGFASSAFHAASYIARLNHADRMTMGLQSAYEAIDEATEGDFNTQSQVLNELTKRHEAMLNPNTHPLSALATQAGFVMYLGLSPAAGLINMLQVPMVTIPYLGARYGFGKASAAMGKAYADIMKAPANRQSGFNAAQSLALSSEERQAISTLQDEGVIDLTQAHDLAAATDRDVGDLARNKTAFAAARAMRIVGWTFHVPEVMNRQTTALMAYRLEREKGSSHEAALEGAREAIKRTQFDYSTSNRARYMQGNIARVVLQFRQFSQNMTYFLGRAAYQALKGESPEVRKIARRQILSTFVVTGAMAGSLGLPGIGAAMGMVGMLVSAMDDEDEPWDWQAEYRNMLADQFGKEWGEVFAKGVPRMLLPGWDIAGRVSLNELWWRSNDREGQNPRESFATDMANILGPTAGTMLGWYVAADHMSRGAYDKAAEAVVPKFIRDPLKAYREAEGGVTSYNGDPLMDVDAWEVLGRSMGFAPSRVSEMYEGRNAVMNAKTAIEERRQRIINQVVKARLDGDPEAEADARSEIAGFNSRNPDFRITNMNIARSLMNRRRNRENTEQGILLPDTKADLRERARFANVE